MGIYDENSTSIRDSFTFIVFPSNKYQARTLVIDTHAPVISVYALVISVYAWIVNGYSYMGLGCLQKGQLVIGIVRRDPHVEEQARVELADLLLEREQDDGMESFTAQTVDESEYR
jgi:hypothetical protein